MECAPQAGVLVIWRRVTVMRKWPRLTCGSQSTWPTPQPPRESQCHVHPHVPGERGNRGDSRTMDGCSSFSGVPCHRGEQTGGRWRGISAGPALPPRAGAPFSTVGESKDRGHLLGLPSHMCADSAGSLEALGVACPTRISERKQKGNR